MTMQVRRHSGIVTMFGKPVRSNVVVNDEGEFKFELVTMDSVPKKVVLLKGSIKQDDFFEGKGKRYGSARNQKKKVEPVEEPEAPATTDGDGEEAGDE